MKFTQTSFITLLSGVLTVIGATLPQLTARDCTSTCGDITTAAALSRDFLDVGKDHFYTWNGWQDIYYVDELGYTPQTENAGRLFTSQEPGTFPLYRLFNSATTTHLYTASLAVRAQSIYDSQPPYADEVIAGYVYLDGSCPGTVPFYWAFSPSLTDNFYTVNLTEYNSFLANGYQAQGIAAWIYPPS